MKKLILILTMVVALSCNAMAFAVGEDFLDERHSQVVTLSGESDIPKLERWPKRTKRRNHRCFRKDFSKYVKKRKKNSRIYRQV